MGCCRDNIHILKRTRKDLSKNDAMVKKSVQPYSQTSWVIQSALSTENSDEKYISRKYDNQLFSEKKKKKKKG